MRKTDNFHLHNSLGLTFQVDAGTLGRLKITLNGDPLEIDGPLAVDQLLVALEIDERRVAVEHNLHILKRAAYGSTLVRDGDRIEVVNAVGGGAPQHHATDDR